MRRTTSRRLAAVAMLTIGAGQLLAPTAEAIGYPTDNGTSFNGVALNGTGEQNFGAQQPAAAPSRVDVGRLRLQRVRLANGR